MLIAGGVGARDYRWDFGETAGRQGWGEHCFHGLTDRGQADGTWALEATAGHPQISSPKIEIRTADQKVIVLRLRYAKGIRAKATFLFITAEDPKWTDESAVSFELATDGKARTYEIDMAGNPRWRGTVTQLRFDPFYVAWPTPADQRTIHIDWIAIPDPSAFTAQPASGADAGLLPNGSLDERGAKGNPRGWTKFVDVPLPIDAGDLRRSGNPANSTLARDAEHGDVFYVRVPPGTKEIGGWQTRADVRPGTIHQLTFAARMANCRYALVAVNEYRDGGKRTAHHECRVKSSHWDTYTLEFQTRPETTAVQVAAIIWKAPGEAWFDDFHLREVSFAAPGGAEAAEQTDNPFDRLTPTVVTPHIPWGVPYVSPPTVLAIPASREIIELGQRLSLEHRTWTPYDKRIKAPGSVVLYDLYYGHRERGFTSYLRALCAELTRPLDVILIARKYAWKTFEWTHLPETVRNRVLEKGRQGSGLIFVRPTAATRRALETAAEKELDIPPEVTAGIPFKGLPVLDKDVADPNWLRCYALGKGRLAIVDYPNESFGFFEIERSLRRGGVSPFTPDVSYDYRVPPVAYDYYLSFLAKLVIWAGRKAGPVSLRDLTVRDGALRASVVAGTEELPDAVELTVAVRDTENRQEHVRSLRLAPGATAFSERLPQLKGGGHFADVWVRHNGRVLDWGSTFFRVRPQISITRVSVDKPHYLPNDDVQATVRLDRPLPGGWSLRLTLTDSLGRRLTETQCAPQGAEASMQLPLSNAVAILHRLTAEIRDASAAVVAEEMAEVLVRRPTDRVDDYRAFFWARNANNDVYNRSLLADLARKGFDGAFIYYLYTQPFEDYPTGYFADTWRHERVNRFVPWYGLFHGMNSIMYWGILSTGWHGFYTPDFRPTPWAAHSVEALREIKRGIGKLLVGSRRDHCGIAVHYSQSSLHAQTLTGRPARIRSVRGVCHLIEDLSLQYDFVSREQMTAGKLSDYRVLILPHSQAIWPDEAQAIRDFAAASGLVCADGPAGVMDGHGKCVEPSMLAGVPVRTLANPAWKYAEVRDLPAGDSWRDELRTVLMGAGIEPPATVTPLDGKLLTGCEVVMFHNGAARYLGLLQGREYLGPEGERPQPRPVRIALPRASHVYDVRKGKYLGLTDNIAIEIEPAVAKLFALLPSPVTQVAAKALKSRHRRGENMQYQIAVSTDSGVVPPLVVRVDVLRPDGTLYKEYSENLSTQNGKTQDSFTLALNDPRGAWKIVARSVASGHRAEMSFEVE